MSRLRDLIVAVVGAGALVFGAQEALASRALLSEPCDTSWNNCAPSRGGQDNCTWCCTEIGQYDYGLCLSFHEGEGEGCLCGYY